MFKCIDAWIKEVSGRRLNKGVIRSIRVHYEGGDDEAGEDGLERVEGM